jgi:hypothetical protein
MEREFVLPTRRDRIAFAILAALGVFATLGLGGWLKAHAAAMRAQPFCEQAISTRHLLLGVGVVMLACMIGCTWKAVRIFRHDQFPPPGARVLRPTRIRRGAMATVIGTLHLLVATGLAVIGVLYLGDAIFQLWPPVPGCPP